MATRMIFLVGSPVPSSLDWENDELLNEPLPPFHNNLNGIPDHKIQGEQPESFTGSDQASAKWRMLQPLPSYQPEDFHPTFYYGPEDSNFLTTDRLFTRGSISAGEDSLLSEFYSHSFAIHETSDANVSGPEYITQDCGTTSDSIVSTVTSSGDQEEDAPGSRRPSFQMRGPICDLQDIPSAAYLESIVPQTMTVNLVVGIIAIHPPRRVVTRHWKTEFDIIEIVVGDETRTGFGINIWLPPERSVAAAKTNQTNQTDRLRRSMALLRPQDIILLRTVGLSSFQTRVYGQTLRGGMTQVDILHRRPVDMTNAGGLYQEGSFHDLHADQPLLLQKARRVREWVIQFICATDGAGGHHSGMSTTHGNRLPPDTQ